MTSVLRPFFSFYGSKWKLSAEYPAPEYGTIIEPFAGSAGYSLRHPSREIVLIERDPVVASVWRWLLDATTDDFLSLPVLKQGDRLDDIDMPDGARALVGFWINQTGARPSHVVTAFGASTSPNGKSRSEMYIRRCIVQAPAIRHWRLIEGDYSAAPDREATWFIDAPYQVEGKKYPYGPSQIDYPALGGWCRDRWGQVIVCENKGADWLNFQDFRDVKGTTYKGKRFRSTEVIWTRAQWELEADLEAWGGNVPDRYYTFADWIAEGIAA